MRFPLAYRAILLAHGEDCCPIVPKIFHSHISIKNKVLLVDQGVIEADYPGSWTRLAAVKCHFENAHKRPLTDLDQGTEYARPADAKTPVGEVTGSRDAAAFETGVIRLKVATWEVTVGSLNACLLGKSELTAVSQSSSKRWSLYALWIAMSLVILWRPVESIIHFAARNDEASHIFLIPFISAAVIYLERRTIFVRPSRGLIGGTLLLVVAAFVGAAAFRWRSSWNASESVAACALALILVWIAGFVLFFGLDSVRSARFPLLLLLLAVPLPDFLLGHAVYFLQKGSAEVVATLFDLTGVPFLREGFVFQLSSVSIEIAEECSGIRSSMAVLILALLAAHFYLRSFWRQSIFIVSSLLVMIVKNGVRIATLTILSIYVSPSFLFGRLHRDGGVVFFLLGLLLLIPILWILARSEGSTNEDATSSGSKSARTQPDLPETSE
jgi:exosortase